MSKMMKPVRPDTSRMTPRDAAAALARYEAENDRYVEYIMTLNAGDLNKDEKIALGVAIREWARSEGRA